MEGGGFDLSVLVRTIRTVREPCFGLINASILLSKVWIHSLSQHTNTGIKLLQKKLSVSDCMNLDSQAEEVMGCY